MKKLLIFLLFSFAMISQAQSLKKGYHGFADVGYCAYISQFKPSTVEVTTAHGYQFNPYIFLGAGFGFDFTGEYKWGEVGGKAYNKRDAKVDIPVFFNARANFTQTRFSPFADARIGAYVNNDGNIYATFSVGVRYALSDNIGLSLSAGYEIRKVTVDQLELISGSKYNNYRMEYYYRDRPGEKLDGFVFRAGVDF
jgi:hypothetical protein